MLYVLNFQMYWQETTLVVDARVNGYNNQEVKVQFRDSRILIIIGESPTCGRFMKIIQLPKNVNVGQIMTELDEGMLKITMPKVNKPKKKNTTITVKVSGCRGRFFY